MLTDSDIVANTTLPYPPGQGFRPFADANLVGGAGRYPCENVTDGSACTVTPYKSWSVEPGKKYRARFVNTGSSSFEVISIDNHILTVIATDFIPVQPYQAPYIRLAVGQRIDVVFTATGSPGSSYWIRAINDPGCADVLPPSSLGFGILSYPASDPSIEPTSLGRPIPPNPLCQTDDLSLTIPVYPIPAITEPDLTLTITIAPSQIISPTTGTGPILFTLNNSSFIGDPSSPLLLTHLSSPSTPFPTSSNIYPTHSARTVRIILINTFLAPHPMHLHGHDFQILAQGRGTWDGSITRPSNPARRDVQMMWFGANATDPNVGSDYLVLQYEADNPGMWELHCHIAWHLSLGMNMVLLEREEELVLGDVPEEVVETCRVYGPWSEKNGNGKAPGR
jgi:FtsP/CotA-like multicopper oxidase with cupredoxin domain